MDAGGRQTIKPRAAATHRHASVHLLWAMPIPVVLSALLLVGALWNYCGINGCTGGGFGVSRDIGATLGDLAPIPFIIGLPIYFVQWSNSRRLRAAVALVSGLAFAWIGIVALVGAAS